MKEKYFLMNGKEIFIEPEHVRKVVASLAKGSFMYSTGQVIIVDGGLTIPGL